MRSWLSILLVLFAVVTVQAGVEKTPGVHPYASAAVLTAGDQTCLHVNDTPLLATASSVTSRLCGSESAPVRVRSSYYIVTGLMRAQYEIYCRPILPSGNSETEHITPPRAADRYVYALRKIII